MDSATFYHLKAAQCRRLAAAIFARGDPAIQALLNMAAEFEARAEEMMGNVAGQVGIGLNGSGNDEAGG